MSKLTEFEKIAKNTEAVKEKISDDVLIVAATKGQSKKTLEGLQKAGISNFGESYVDEFCQKYEGFMVGDASDNSIGNHNLESSSKSKNVNEANAWHFIGQLQSNKVRHLAGMKISLFQNVDRPSLITELAKHFKGNDILIQLDTTGIPKRGGAEAKEIPALIDLAIKNSLNPVGIMVLAHQIDGQNKDEAIQDFKLAKKIQTDLGLKILSAGMSDDFELAVGEGANMIRLGRVLFQD